MQNSQSESLITVLREKRIEKNVQINQADSNINLGICIKDGSPAKTQISKQISTELAQFSINDANIELSYMVG